MEINKKEIWVNGLNVLCDFLRIHDTIFTCEPSLTVFYDLCQSVEVEYPETTVIETHSVISGNLKLDPAVLENNFLTRDFLYAKVAEVLGLSIIG